MKNLLVLATIGLLAVACGSITGSNPGPTNPSPTPSSGTGLGFDATVTEQDHALTMRAGQKLEVVLHGGTNITWQQVQSNNTEVLMPIVHPAATAVRGVTLAAFQAKTAGSAEVTAVGTPNCQPGQACPMYAMLYRLEVTVTQ